MIKKIVYSILLLCSTISLFSKSSLTFNGQLESSFVNEQKRSFKDTVFSEYSWGWNNYANLRLKGEIGDYFSVNLAFNLNLLSGNFTDSIVAANNQMTSALAVFVYNAIANPQNTANRISSHSFLSTPLYFMYKNTFIGSIELERFYFKAGNDYFDIQTGLMRISKGYGYSFSPMDFLNPKNPVNPSARPEGKLAFLTTFYPQDMWKIEAFVIAPDDPIEQSGIDFKLGAATQFSTGKFNFEFLYTLFFPQIDYLVKKENSLPDYLNSDYSHIVGFSMKADIQIGLYVDMIYRFDQNILAEYNRSGEWRYYGKPFYGYEGLEAAIGIDYTVPIPQSEGKFYFLLEYLFYGSGMLDWPGNPAGTRDQIDSLYTDSDWKIKPLTERTPDFKMRPLTLLRHDYLFGMIQYTVNTYVSFDTSYLFGIDDQSGLLTVAINIEPFQAFSININAMFPFSYDMFYLSDKVGEFSPTMTGFIQRYSISAKMKF